MKAFLFSFVVLISISGVNLHGQGIVDKAITIDGVIISKEDGNPVPFVHVINLNTNQGIASNSQGRFVLQMKPTDSLVFSAIGFDKYVFELKEVLNISRLDITIEMSTSSMELAPVQIFAYKDARAIKQAILDMKVTTKPEREIIQIPGFNYGPRKEVEPNVLLNPVSFLYSKVSKRAKEEIKYKRLEIEYDVWRDNVFEKFNPTLVQETTGLSEDVVDDFMLFCKLEDSFIRLSTQYEVVVAINKCLAEYLGDEKVNLDK